MNTRNLLKQIPYAKMVYRKIRTWSNNRVLKPLEKNPYPQGIQIMGALKSLQRELPQSDQEWKERIEVERYHLAHRNGPLNDGSLGDQCLYDLGITIAEACLSSKPPEPALFLFLITRALKPLNVIELGTNVGISSSYIGAALKVNGQNGKLCTLDLSPYRQRLAKEVHRNLGIDNISYVEGYFTDTLRSSLENLGSVDLAFVDGHHQYQATIDYFEEILAFSNSATVFIFDDIRWSDGMKKAWSQIQSDHRLGLIIDLFSVGVCVRSQKNVSQYFVFGPIKVF
jgi:predicted O-methyltransferase YrrM